MNSSAIQLLSGYRYEDLYQFNIIVTKEAIKGVSFSDGNNLQECHHTVSKGIENNCKKTQVTLYFTTPYDGNVQLIFSTTNGNKIHFTVQQKLINRLDIENKSSGILIFRSRLKHFTPKTIMLGLYQFTKSSIEQLASRQIISFDKPCKLIVDHSLGGGANQYSKEKYFSPGDLNEIHLLSFNTLVSKYTVSVFKNNQKTNYYFPNIQALTEQLKKSQYDEITINNLVSFPNPEILVLYFSYLATSKQTLLNFNVHDYLCICPKWNLINNHGEYCNLPDKDICEICLKTTNAIYTHYHFSSSISIWRELHYTLFTACNEIRIFSLSTMELLKRTYPLLQDSKISLVPHQVDYIRSVNLSAVDTSEIVVGIIGKINEIKGLEVIESLLSTISTDPQSKIRIVVIGSALRESTSNKIRYTGTYLKENLSEIVERERVNLFLYPSICPETFSYVAEEMYHMNLPIVLFDIGAPAQRLAFYTKARIVDLSEKNNLTSIIEEYFTLHYKK